jgi:hypothetical protein
LTGKTVISTIRIEELSISMADLPSSVPSAHSAAIYRYAVELVEDTRRANETRMADARDLASVVRIADEPAADRILGAAEEACARDLHIAEQQAEEVIRHARAGIMAAVQRYAQALVEDARNAGQSRLDKATELAELVRLADANSADRLLQAIHTVNEAALRTAERQAQGVLETAQTRLAMAGRVGETSAYSSQTGSAPVLPQSETGAAPAATAAATDYADTVQTQAPSFSQAPGNGAPPAEPHTEEADYSRYRPEESQ